MSSSRDMLVTDSEDVSLVSSSRANADQGGDRAVDIFDTFDDEARSDVAGAHEQPWIIRTLKRIFFTENWFFLVLLGIICGAVAFGIDIAIHYLYIGTNHH